MFDRKSRYADVDDTTLTTVDLSGAPRLIPYKRRRFIPGPGTLVLAEHVITQADRVDLLAARYVGDPEQFWRICDANAVLSPDELIEEMGRRVRIAAPSL